MRSSGASSRAAKSTPRDCTGSTGSDVSGSREGKTKKGARRANGQARGIFSQRAEKEGQSTDRLACAAALCAVND